MSLSFRTLAIGIGAIGIGFGISFGAGAAYGRGAPKTVQSGLTQQQIQQLYGAPTNPAAAQAGGLGSAPTGGSGGAGAPSAGAQSPSSNPAAARATSGRVTSIAGQTVMLETSRGTEKVNLSPSAMVSKIAPGALADIKNGMTVFVSGTRNADGSFDDAALTEVSAELLAVLSVLTTTSVPTPPSETPTAR